MKIESKGIENIELKIHYKDRVQTINVDVEFFSKKELENSTKIIQKIQKITFPDDQDYYEVTNIIMEDIQQIECEACEGTGKSENIGYGCTMPASECCGGCSFDAGECYDCSGTGIIETMEYND